MQAEHELMLAFRITVREPDRVRHSFRRGLDFRLAGESGDGRGDQENEAEAKGLQQGMEHGVSSRVRTSVPETVAIGRGSHKRSDSGTFFAICCR